LSDAGKINESSWAGRFKGEIVIGNTEFNTPIDSILGI
jgi:hypothetical protein